MPLPIFIVYVLWLVTLLIFAFGMVVFIWTLITSAPFVQTPEKTIQRILSHAEVKPSETVYDLGCGDGRILTYAAQHFKAFGVGVERHFVLAAVARLRVRILRLGKRVTIIRGNLFCQDIEKADVIVLYLIPKIMQRLESKLQQELKSGTRVVSRHFTFPNWKPVKVDKEERLYLYVVK